MSDQIPLKAMDRMPWIMPALGGLAGVVLWLLDAVIDVHLLGDEQTLLESVFEPEGTEAWMRSLVVIVLVAMGWMARISLKRHLQLEQLRGEYTERLEKLVMVRTSELEDKTRQLEEQANRDHLTKLFNRRHLQNCLQHEVDRYKRTWTVFSVMFLDVDHFKAVNDNYGHDVGDSVLIEIARRLCRFTRTTDVCGRWGGEEFLLLLPATEAAQAVVLAEKLLLAIRDEPFELVGRVTVSAGVAACRAGESVDGLLSRVDRALYQAKRAGRDRLVASRS